MQERWARRSVGVLGGIAAVLLLAAPGRAEPFSAGTQPQDSPRAAPHAAPEASQYWLGIQCRPADDVLRAQLHLPPSQGLVAEDVAPQSPAAKDGIQQYDVLVAANGKPLSEIKDLANAVSVSQGKVISLDVIRGGQGKQVTVKPARRPKEVHPVPRVPHMTGDAEIIRKWLEELYPDGSLRLRYFHRGLILPADAPAQPPLPKDVTITVTKRADELAKLIVQRGDEKWEVTERELHKLPEALRPYAEQMLGRMCPAGVDPAHLLDFGPLSGTDREESGNASEADDATERHLEAMSRQLERLQEAMERLQRQQAPEPR